MYNITGGEIMKRKIKNNKIVIYFFLFLISYTLLIISFKLPKNTKSLSIRFDFYSKKVSDILNYNKYVKTKNEITIYDKDLNECGSINKDIDLELESLYLRNNKIYYKIKNLDYYIEPDNIEKIEIIEKNNRYKKYVVFNKNVITKNNTTLYNENGYVYRLNKGINTPLIINDKDKYYVEYNNELLYVKKENA